MNKTNYIRFTFYLFVTAATLTSCGAEEALRVTPSLSSLTQLTTSRLWKKKDLNVCFDQKKYSDKSASQYEDAIAKAAKKSFTSESTGISLSGFSKCTSGEDVAFIFKNIDATGAATNVGQFVWPDLPSSEKNGDQPTVYLGLTAISQMATEGGKVSVETAVVEYALHELGHTVGLFHEHAHPKSTCGLRKETGENAKEAKEQYGSDTYIDKDRGYDAYSVMSYCKTSAVLGNPKGPEKDSGLDLAKVQVGLSDKDKEFLKMIYSDKTSSDDATSDDSKSKDSKSKDSKSEKPTSDDSTSKDSKSSDSTSGGSITSLITSLMSSAGNMPGGNMPGGNMPGGNMPGGNMPGGNMPPQYGPMMPYDYGNAVYYPY